MKIEVNESVVCVITSQAIHIMIKQLAKEITCFSSKRKPTVCPKNQGSSKFHVEKRTKTGLSEVFHGKRMTKGEWCTTNKVVGKFLWSINFFSFKIYFPLKSLPRVARNRIE